MLCDLSCWHETVTTLHLRYPAPKPYALTAFVENWSVWAGKLDGRKEVKEQWDQAHWDEGWCVPTAVAWDDYISALAKISGLSGRKEGDPQLVHTSLVYSYTNNSNCTKDHTYVKYQGQGSGLVSVQKIIMLIVTIWNYWAITYILTLLFCFICIHNLHSRKVYRLCVSFQLYTETVPSTVLTEAETICPQSNWLKWGITALPEPIACHLGR